MIKKRILCAVFLMLSLTTAASADSIPANIWEFTTDYYDVIGEPGLSVSVVGNPEYESSKTSTIYIQLMNDGLIYGFDTDEIPSNANETMDAQTELDREYDVTTAINIRAVLENDKEAPLKVLSGLQQGGSLRSGEVSEPMEFDIEVYNNAPFGTYELTLNLTYQYQYDVKVEGYPEQEFDYLYATVNQTLPVTIKIEPRAVFEIEEVYAHLNPGDSSVLYITYKNVGSQTAEDAVARISVVDPFSTTDDQAFLGTLEPGNSYQGRFLLKVDGDALTKTYGINTEVKYRDEQGDIQISDVMKAPVDVYEPKPLIEKLWFAGWLAILIVLGAAGYIVFRKMRGGK